MQFEWDENKAESNWQKHGISFHDAATIFADALSFTVSDPDHSIREQRYLTIGLSRTSQTLVVAHTDRNDKIRIISARKATPRERRYYEEH